MKCGRASERSGLVCIKKMDMKGVVGCGEMRMTMSIEWVRVESRVVKEMGMKDDG